MILSADNGNNVRLDNRRNDSNLLPSERSAGNHVLGRTRNIDLTLEHRVIGVKTYNKGMQDHIYPVSGKESQFICNIERGGGFTTHKTENDGTYDF